MPQVIEKEESDLSGFHFNAEKGIKDSKILVVDDAEFSRCIIVEVFSSNGFKNIKIAKDGAEALEVTRRYKPDLVILDLLMPEVDGFEYCEIIRAEEEFKNMPILVQSATNSPKRIAQAFQVGATDFVNKPINSNEILARAIVHLENRSLLYNLGIYRARVEGELNNAKEMQKTIMPAADYLQEIEKDFNLNIADYFETSSELGGDFWGVRPVSHNELAIYSVDFSGHGVTAALNTFRMHTILQEERMFYSSPSVFLSKLNNRLVDLMVTGQYATMFYAVMNIEGDFMSYASAGAPPPYLVKKNGDVKVLENSGIPLGIQKDVAYDVKTTKFLSSESMLLYSDALVETENKSGEFFKEEYIKKFLKETKSVDAKKKLRMLLQKFHIHTGGMLVDDLTISIYERK